MRGFLFSWLEMRVSCSAAEGGLVFHVKMMSHPFCRLEGMMTVQVSQPPPIPDPERNKEEPRQEKTQVEFLFIILL